MASLYSTGAVPVADQTVQAYVSDLRATEESRHTCFSVPPCDEIYTACRVMDLQAVLTKHRDVTMASSTIRSVLLAIVALLALFAVNAPMVNAGQSCGDGLACPDNFQCCVQGPGGCCQNIDLKGVPSCTVCVPPSGRKLM